MATYPNPETFHFTYNGEPGQYSLKTWDAVWTIECRFHGFLKIAGAATINNLPYFSKGLLQIGEVDPELMLAMWEPFKNKFESELKAYAKLKNTN